MRTLFRGALNVSEVLSGRSGVISGRALEDRFGMFKESVVRQPADLEEKRTCTAPRSTTASHQTVRNVMQLVWEKC